MTRINTAAEDNEKIEIAAVKEPAEFKEFFDFAWRVATIAQVYALIDYYSGRD